jgi:hypothetical protein
MMVEVEDAYNGDWGVVVGLMDLVGADGFDTGPVPKSSSLGSQDGDHQQSSLHNW